MMSQNKINTDINFFDKSAVIVCHDAMFGPPHELRNFLLSHGIQRLLFIGHQNRTMEENDITSSYYELYEKGKKMKRYVSPVSHTPEFIGYVKDSILTFYWTLRIMHGSTDYYIGLGNLNAFMGLMFRALGSVQRVYYYVIDYIPNRYQNMYINNFYHWIDNLCAQYADSTWNYGQRMIEERSIRWNRQYKHQLVVQNGVSLHADVYKDLSEIHINELMYLGTLHEGQGIQLIIEALPEIIRSFPSIHVSIIGKGCFRKHLEHMIEKKQLEKYVTFLGYIANPLIADRRVAKAAIGLATYIPTNALVIYTEPGKVKRYFACGLPVIMTDVGPIAKESSEAGCCMVIPYKAHDLARTVIGIIKNKSKLDSMKKSALTYVKQFEWDTVFSRAFKESL